MAAETFEQLSVPRRLFGSRADYLTEGSSVLVLFADGEPVAGVRCAGSLCLLRSVTAQRSLL